jgi:hypothetical protein
MTAEQLYLMAAQRAAFDAQAEMDARPKAIIVAVDEPRPPELSPERGGQRVLH